MFPTACDRLSRELDLTTETTYRHRLRIEIPDASKDTRKLPREVIECPIGKYQCDGVAGSDSGHWPSERGPQTQFEYETRLHKDVSFGVVAHRCEMKQYSSKGKLVLRTVTKFTLAEVGNYARSEIPDDEVEK